jgi:A/G-specific adenine glycosylase
LWLRRADQVWLVQRPPQGVWAGLWSFPEWDEAETLVQLTSHWRGQGEWLEPVQHALTHFDWTLQPLAWTLPSRAAVPPGLPGGADSGRWFTNQEALALGLPAPIRKLLTGP